MKRASEPSSTKGPKRPRATDLMDPSRPWVRPVDHNAPSSSSSVSHQAVSSAPRLNQPAQATVPDPYKEPPRWDHMQEQLLHLPVHLPHCLPYIIDEAVSMAPEEPQSVIQGCGMCTNAYNCLRHSLLTISWRVASSMPNPPFPVAQLNELYFILGFNVESASHFERLGAFGRDAYCWKEVDSSFRTVVRTCL